MSGKKQHLPQERVGLISIDPDEICGHLKPILQYLQAEGAAIERRDKSLPNCRLAVVLDSFFYRNQIYSKFEIPPFIVWSYADAHYGEGNQLWCEVCHNSLESKFDQSDPERTIGEGL